MPRKIRELRRDLVREGFQLAPRRGKGSHTYWRHPSGVTANIPGHDGDDAPPYLEKHVRRAIELAHKQTS